MIPSLRHCWFLVLASYALSACGSSSAGDGQISISTQEDGDWEIVLLDLGTGIAHQITDNTTFDWGATWSPDGKQLAYSTTYLDGEIRDTLEPDENGNMMLVSREVTGEQDIVLTTSGQSSLSHLTTNSAIDDEPAWSPDGRRLAYSSDVSGDVEIYTIGLGGQGETRLTDSVGEDWHPDWSPDGSRIAFTSARSGSWDLFTMATDGGAVRQLTATDEDEWRPSWSPDGKRIAFAKAAREDSNWDLFVMDQDGNNIVQLTDDPATDFEPGWSPDGKRIAFASNRSGQMEVYVMEVDDSSIEPLSIQGIPSAWTRHSRYN